MLYVIACGGRPAGDLPDFVRHAQALEWDVCVIATPSGMKFVDAGQLARLTGHPVRSDYKRPDPLEEFVGNRAYGMSQLREDLERFAFLPGGSDGEPLFGP